MGEMISFPSNGDTGSGYFAGGGGAPVVVIQEWWGLVPHIRDLVDRFAEAGFSALAPDLYRGESTTEPDEAGKHMMSLELKQASSDLSGAVDELQARTGRHQVGVIGFCMGGALALRLACDRPDAVAACAPFYGVVKWPADQPDWAALASPVRGHYASDDGSAPPDAVAAMAEMLRALGKDVEITTHADTKHAFFNDSRPEVFDADAAAKAWSSTLDFFAQELQK
jgi:carboxymethylenebutenolidase